MCRGVFLLFCLLLQGTWSGSPYRTLSSQNVRKVKDIINQYITKHNTDPTKIVRTKTVTYSFSTLPLAGENITNGLGPIWTDTQGRPAAPNGDTYVGSCNPCGLGDVIGSLVRLLFHDAAGQNGANGCIDWNTADHKGLEAVVADLDALYTANSLSSVLSKADFWVLAGITAISRAAAPNTPPTIPFLWGRVDAPTCSDIGLLPNAEGDHTLLNSYFVRRLNFTMQETAALMGAHTLGRMEGRFSGFSGGWTPRHHALTNSYYSAAVGVVWDKRLRNGKIVWEAPRLACDDPQLETSCGQTVVMLNVDMALFTDVSLGTCTKFPAPPNNVGSCVDSPFRTYSKAYTSSTSQGKWIKDFALAIAKMTKIGYAANALYSVDFVRSSI